MERNLKVGVISLGFIGQIHVEAIERTFLADVVAVAGRTNSEALQQKAKRFGIPRCYGSYKELLQDHEVEVVHICSPNTCHYQMAREALLAGKHVVCEKPLTVSLSEAEELVALAEKKHLVNAVHFNVRYYPLVRQARTMVEKGDIGDIFAVTGSYLQDWLFYDTDYSWRLETEQSGPSRAIGDIGSHWLDLIEYITRQRVSEVMADFGTFHKFRKKPNRPVETWSGKILRNDEYTEVPIHTEDYASVLLHFENGTQGAFTVNQMAAGRKNRVYYEMNGSKASLVWNSEQPDELIIGNRDRGNEVLMRDPSLLYEEARALTSYPGGHNEGFADTSKQLFREIYRYILDGQKGPPLFPTFYDGYRQALLCEAILESARTKQWVSVK